jgi:predicted peptidase
MDHEKLIRHRREDGKEYKIDEKRQYITGLSMGGMGTWSLICKYPDKWTAAAPSAVAGIRPMLEDQGICRWNFHGDKDAP